MNVGVLLFAGARDAVGKKSVVTQVSDGASVTTLLRQLTTEYPRLESLLDVTQVAVNEEYVPREHVLADGDEVALIPPVSGGSDDGPFLVVDRPITPDELHESVRSSGDGAVLTFSGVVRDRTGSTVTDHLVYEAYGSMAQKKMQQLACEARERWPIGRVAMVHRTGRLEVGEISILLSVASPHRAAAFHAGQFLIDRLKEEVPIWKKEVGPSGDFWVEGPGEHGTKSAPVDA